MSLDIYLNVEEPIIHYSSGIFVRIDGATREVSREQWDEMNPGQEPLILNTTYEMTNCVFSVNITHNLGSMAQEAELYRLLWRPEELNIIKARQVIEPLRTGIKMLEANPAYFKKFNPPNGWGSYEQLLNTCIGYLGACEQWPEAEIRVSR